jgi:Tfp pilus assembly protein PilF
LRAAIQADPNSAEAHNTLGSLDLKRGDLKSAGKEFVEAIRLNPRFAPQYNLGLILRQQHRKGVAAREFQEALSADPQFRPARDALDRLKLETDEIE